MVEPQTSAENRQSFGARMAAARAAKKSAAPTLPPAQPDAIVPTEPPRAQSHRRVPSGVVAAVAPSADHAAVVSHLTALSPDPFTFDGVSAIMTALTAAYDRFGLARTQKRAQLDAGDHIAHCDTCGGRIDISRSGSFQVLTVRDEHFQPKNLYFDSVNCVLARGSKGRQRPTPGPHNQAGSTQP